VKRVCGIGDEAAPGLADQLRIHADLGLPAIELRTVAGKWLHDLSDAEIKTLATEIEAASLTVPVVDTPLGGWSVTVGGDFDTELRLLDRYATVAQAVGCDWLRVMSYPNDGRPEAQWRAEALRRMARLVQLASDLGVSLLHENCHGWASQSAETTLEMLAETGGQLGLIFDVGNGLAYGYESVPFLKAVLPHVQHVHVKDGVRGSTVAFGLPGEGEAGLADCVKVLDEAGYDGWYSMEPHVAHSPHLGVTGTPEELEAGYRACVEKFRWLID
jgi:sugar phosphate isomerase/epimerase